MRRGGASAKRRRLTANPNYIGISDVLRCGCGKLLRYNGAMRAAFNIGIDGKARCLSCELPRITA